MDIHELRTLLKFEGVDLYSYTDEELNILIKSKVQELKGKTGIDVTPTHRKQTITNFHGTTLRLDFYPVYKFASLKIDGCPYHKYRVNEDIGVVYFKKPVNGDVTVKYISGLSEDVVATLVEPLIRNMIISTMSKKDIGVSGPVSSLKEGDVSVNYDTSNNVDNKINSQIAELKNMYSSARLRWL